MLKFLQAKWIVATPLLTVISFPCFTRRSRTAPREAAAKGRGQGWAASGPGKGLRRAQFGSYAKRENGKLKELARGKTSA